MWLTTAKPERWGPIEIAMRYVSSGEARRAATAVKLAKSWEIEAAPSSSF
jgi:hypothetical protein